MSTNDALMAAQPDAAMVDRFWSHVSVADPDRCWLWTGRINWNGYGMMHVSRARSVKAHRMSFEITNGRAPKGCVLHRCDVRSCVNPGHLFEGTQSDNLADMRSKGRGVRGDRNPQSKLNNGSVLEIKKRLLAGEEHQQIADSYGVCRATISLINSGRTWKHVKESV